MPIAAPYGSWPSPITTDLVASEGGVSFGYLDIDEHGVYWTESRPQESGRSALVFRPHGGEPVDVVPTDFNVRTRVHEYGGGAWFRHGSVVFCSSFDDSRLYRIEAPGSEPQPITPEPPEPHAFRYRGRPRLRGWPADRLRPGDPRRRGTAERARRPSDRRLRRATA